MVAKLKKEDSYRTSIDFSIGRWNVVVQAMHIKQLAKGSQNEFFVGLIYEACKKIVDDEEARKARLAR